MHLLLALLLLISACSPAQEADRQTTVAAPIDSNKVLIVYLSRTNNTKAIAKMIQKQVGGKLVSLELVTPYPDDYRTTVEQVARENEMGFLPPLKTRFDRIEQYDIVFLGFPTWGMQLPPPMKSFLRQYARDGGPLSGKILIPFNSNAGYGIGSTFQTVKELCPNSKILEGFTTKGGVERDGQLLVIKGQRANEVQADVKKWLQRLKVIAVVR